MSVHEYLMPDPGWQQVAATVAVGTILGIAGALYVVTGIRSALGRYDEAVGPATPRPSATASDSVGNTSELSEAVLLGALKT